MAEKMKCLRCDGEMKYAMTEKLQLGQTGWILGDLPNLLAGAMQVDVYACDTCGRLEFFRTDLDLDELTEDTIAQKKCPKCGMLHDIDFPKCPFCKFDYNA